MCSRYTKHIVNFVSITQFYISVLKTRFNFKSHKANLSTKCKKIQLHNTE